MNAVLDGILAAIREEPTESTHWLVLADWLEEDGQGERAELVRLQWSLRDARGGAKRRAAEERVRELLLAGVRPCAPTWVSATTGMELALIPPGRFRMGSPVKEPRRMEDETLHTVTITKPF